MRELSNAATTSAICVLPMSSKAHNRVLLGIITRVRPFISVSFIVYSASARARPVKSARSNAARIRPANPRQSVGLLLILWP